MKIAGGRNYKSAAAKAVNEGKVVLALQLLNGLKALNPEDAEGWLNSGTIYLQYLKNYEEAKTNFLEVLKLDARNIEARIGLANVYQMQGDRTKSVEVLNEALRIDPENDNVRRALAAISGQGVSQK